MAGASRPDIVTPEEPDSVRLIALARASMDARLAVAYRSALAQGFVWAARGAAVDVEEERRSPVSSELHDAPHASDPTIPRSPVSSIDNTKGEPPL